MSWKEKVMLILLALVNFTHILDFMVMMPLGNFLMPYFTISPKEFSFLVSAYTISAALTGFLSAFFVNQYDRKKVLLFGFIGFLLGTIGCGIAPTYHILFSMRVLAGLFGGLIGAQVVSIIADSFAYERRGVAMGAIMSSFAVASTFGIPFALYLANHFSWHAPFIFLGTIGFLLLPLLYFYLPSMTNHIEKHIEANSSKIEVIISVLKNKQQYLALILSGLIMFGHFLIIPFINPFMEFNVGFSKNITPLIYLVGGISSFFASNILGRLSDKYGKLIIFNYCVLLALPLIFLITNLPQMQSYQIVLTMFGLWFIAATGRGVTSGAMVSNVVDSAHRGSFQSFNSSMQQLGSGLAALLSGYIVTKNYVTNRLENYDVVGYISILALIVCLFFANYIFKKMESIKKVQH